MSMSRTVLLSASAVLCLIGAPAPIIAGGTAPPGRNVKPKERPLPPGAIARLGSLRLRHEYEVRSIAFSPDGKMIASVPEYLSTIRVWDTETGKLLHEFNAPGIFSREFGGYDDYALAFTPDGKAIAAGVETDVCFWELQSGRAIRRFHVGGKGILALTFSRDGKSFYCGASDNKLYQFHIASGKQLRCWDYFEGNQPLIYPGGFTQKCAVLKAISSDGKSVAWLVDHWIQDGNAYSRDASQLKIWDVASAKDRCRITDKKDEDFFDAKTVFSADGKYLTAHTQNSEMIIWDAATGRALYFPLAFGAVDPLNELGATTTNDEDALPLQADFSYGVCGCRIEKVVHWDGEGKDRAKVPKFAAAYN